MKLSSISRSPALAHFLREFARWTGIGVAAFGLLAVIAWHAHWRPVLQVLPGTKPMQYNTALCFIVIGIGLHLVNTGRERIAIWFGAVVAGFVSLNLFEHLASLDLGVDELFLRPYFDAGYAHLGRISPLGSVCFLLSSVSIILSGAKKRTHARLTAAGFLSCVVGVISFLALLGYAFGITAAYGWGGNSPMAFNTCGLFLWLSLGLLTWSFQKARAEKLNFVRWLPVAAAGTLMVMIVFVSMMNTKELKVARFWRKHTFDVILTAQSFEENLIDMQLGTRGYLTMGDTNALAAYRESALLEPEKLTELQTLTHDNPAQQQSLQLLARAMTEVFAYDERVIALRNREGAAAPLDQARNNEGRRVFLNARDIIKVISKNEEGLLSKRDGLEQVDSANAERLLIFGSAVAAILLVFASVMASSELKRRRQIESRLLEISSLQNAILNSAHYAIIALRPDGVVRTFNPAAERMLGYTADEVVGKETPILWRDPQEVAQTAEALSEELGREIKPGVEIITANPLNDESTEYDVTYIHKNGKRFPVHVSFTALTNEAGSVTGFMGVISDITEQRQHETERETMISELQSMIVQVKTLSGMIPICGWCKSIRSDKGYWQSVEQYVRDNTAATFSHGICPECSGKLKNDILKHGVAKPAPAAT